MDRLWTHAIGGLSENDLSWPPKSTKSQSKSKDPKRGRDVICRIETLDDPRLDPYRDLKKTNWTRESAWFIAEGKWVVRRCSESNYEVLSVLLADHAVESFGTHIPPNTPILVLPSDLVSQLVGFEFHAGVIACVDVNKHKTLGTTSLAY